MSAGIETSVWLDLIAAMQRLGDTPQQVHDKLVDHGAPGDIVAQFAATWLGEGK